MEADASSAPIPPFSEWDLDLEVSKLVYKLRKGSQHSLKVTLSPVSPSQDEKDFLGVAGLTTLPQVVTTPSSVGVVSSFAKLLF